MVSQDYALSLLRSLVKELRSHKLPGAAKKKKKKRTHRMEKFIFSVEQGAGLVGSYCMVCRILVPRHS